MFNNQRSQIEKLKEELLFFYDQVWQQHLDLVESLEQSSLERAKKISLQEVKVNSQYNSFFKKTFYNLAQHNFYASNLRKILAYIQIAKELERIADFANNFSLFLTETKFSHHSQELQALLTAWKKILPFFKVIKQLFFSEKIEELLHFLKNNDYKKSFFQDSVHQLQQIYQKKAFSFNFYSVFFLKQLFAFKRTFEHLENIVEYLLLIRSFQVFKKYKVEKNLASSS